MYTKFLLPTDGSQESHRAVAHAAHLAGALDATVLVLEVIESEREVRRRASTAGWMPSGTGFVTDANVVLLIEAEQRAAKHHMEMIERELRESGVASVETLIVQGQPGPAIVQAAADAACDAIVIATHGHAGLTHLLLGSVAEYVARSAGCAVVLVPPARRQRSRQAQ
jgi:nucleotide-binding universal stress UspA family protein